MAKAVELGRSLQDNLKVIAFDCFGTVFDAATLSRQNIEDYNEVKKQLIYRPYDFPEEWYKLRPHIDSGRGIRRLRERYRVCTMSNGSVDLLSHLSREASIDWDLITPIELAQVYKPDPRAYLLLPQLFHCRVDQVLMVTANPAFGDCEACVKIGMPFAIIRHPNTPADIMELARKLGL